MSLSGEENVRVDQLPLKSETDSGTPLSGEYLAALLSACLAVWGDFSRPRREAGMPVWKRSGLLELMERGTARRDLL